MHVTKISSEKLSYSSKIIRPNTSIILLLQTELREPSTCYMALNSNLLLCMNSSALALILVVTHSHCWQSCWLLAVTLSASSRTLLMSAEDEREEELEKSHFWELVSGSTSFTLCKNVGPFLKTKSAKSSSKKLPWVVLHTVFRILASNIFNNMPGFWSKFPALEMWKGEVPTRPQKWHCHSLYSVFNGYFGTNLLW